jgi:hypothetical protein
MEKQMLDNCGKCSGKGTLPHYSHINSGVCFQCGGTGTVRGIPYQGPKDYQEPKFPLCREIGKRVKIGPFPDSQEFGYLTVPMECYINRSRWVDNAESPAFECDVVTLGAHFIFLFDIDRRNKKIINVQYLEGAEISTDLHVIPEALEKLLKL